MLNFLLELLAVASFYQNEDTKYCCEIELEKYLSIDNCTVFIETADLYSASNLYKICFNFIKDNFNLMKTRDDFNNELNESIRKKIIQHVELTTSTK